MRRERGELAPFLLGAGAAGEAGADLEAAAPGVEVGVLFGEEEAGIDLLDEGAAAVDLTGAGDDAGEDCHAPSH